MKNTFIFAAAASLLALTACTNEDSVELNQGRKINFRPAMATRATETNNSNLVDFKASAFLGSTPYFLNETFSKSSGSSFYNSIADYYWPGDDSELSFVAYAPVDLQGVTIKSTEKSLADFSPASDIKDQIDFISAQATGKKSLNEGPGVPLDFNHNLAQIEVRGLTNNKNYTFKITGIRIGEPIATGSFDFDSNAWTLATNKTDYESVYATPIVLGADAQSLMGANGNAMILPQQLTAWDPKGDASNTRAGAYLSVKLQINILDSEGNEGLQIYPFPSNGDCIWAAIPINTNWQPGKKYIYTLDFSHGAGYVDPKNPNPGTPVLGGPIKFTVNVEDWVDTPSSLDMKTYTPAENN